MTNGIKIFFNNTAMQEFAATDGWESEAHPGFLLVKRPGESIFFPWHTIQSVRGRDDAAPA